MIFSELRSYEWVMKEEWDLQPPVRCTPPPLEGASAAGQEPAKPGTAS